MRFVTAYNRVRPLGEFNDGPSLVDTAGYVPARKLIESYMRAGHNLAAARAAGEYDFPAAETVDESFFDPTRQSGFDFGDAAELASTLSYSLRAQREAAEQAAADAAQAAVADTTEGDDVPK